MHKEKEMRILNIATKRKWYIQIPFKTEIRGQGEPPKAFLPPISGRKRKNVWNSWIYWIK
jgi:hypothetical protein